MADDDISVYFLLKQINYFLLKHLPTQACYFAEKKIHSTRQAQLVHHDYLGSHKADPEGFG